MIFIVLSSLETVHDTVQYRYRILSLVYCLLRIRLKHQNHLLSYIRERERERENGLVRERENGLVRERENGLVREREKVHCKCTV